MKAIKRVYLWGKVHENRSFRFTFQWPENLVQWCVILSGKRSERNYIESSSRAYVTRLRDKSNNKK